MEYDDPKECVERLGILLKAPLSGKKLRGPVWWFRGGSNLDVGKFEKVSEDKFLLDSDEIKVKRIVVYAALQTEHAEFERINFFTDYQKPSLFTVTACNAL